MFVFGFKRKQRELEELVEDAEDAVFELKYEVIDLRHLVDDLEDEVLRLGLRMEQVTG